MKTGWMMSLVVLFCSHFAVAQETDVEPEKVEKAPSSDVFRERFTLKVRVDEEHYYEEAFGKIPYVHDGGVYLFSGEAFGISLDVKDGAIAEVHYCSKVEDADVSFRFSQEVKNDGADVSMMLVIKNQTERKILFDALMTIPGKEGIYETSILPLSPKISGYEMWPHAIVQLVLQNIRLSPDTEDSEKKAE